MNSLKHFHTLEQIVDFVEEFFAVRLADTSYIPGPFYPTVGKRPYYTALDQFDYHKYISATFCSTLGVDIEQLQFMLEQLWEEVDGMEEPPNVIGGLPLTDNPAIARGDTPQGVRVSVQTVTPGLTDLLDEDRRLTIDVLYAI